jgi:protein-L-isoaspartate O-methyltransferase
LRCQVACVDALRIDETCDVLEIGFGCGYARVLNRVLKGSRVLNGYSRGTLGVLNGYSRGT